MFTVVFATILMIVIIFLCCNALPTSNIILCTAGVSLRIILIWLNAIIRKRPTDLRVYEFLPKTHFSDRIKYYNEVWR